MKKNNHEIILISTGSDGPIAARCCSLQQSAEGHEIDGPSDEAAAAESKCCSWSQTTDCAITFALLDAYSHISPGLGRPLVLRLVAVVVVLVPMFMLRGFITLGSLLALVLVLVLMLGFVTLSWILNILARLLVRVSVF